MRFALAATALCLIAAPAFAQSQAQAQAKPDKARAVADALQNPMVQEGLATVMAQLAGIALDTRVGPMLHYADPTIGENDTIADIQRRRDPQFDRHLRDNARHAAAMAGQLAGDAVAMRDSLTDTRRKLDAALAPLRDALTGITGD
jgi:hypothetical protein